MSDADDKARFWAAVEDPDPSSIEVAQDIALEHGWKLWQLAEECADTRTLWFGHRTKKAEWESVGGFWFRARGSQNGCDWKVTLPAKRHTRMQRGVFVNYVIEMFFEYFGSGTLADHEQWQWESSGLYPTIYEARRAAARYAWHALKVMKNGYADGATSKAVREVIEARHPDELIPELNPMTKNPDDLAAAREKYREFHRYDSKDVGAFPKAFTIPKRMRLAGKGKWVTYRSSKVDPSTLEKPKRPIDYIHEHDAGVRTYIKDADPDTDVPEKFRDVGALVKLGECLGFCVIDGDGEEVEAEGRAPLPELYTTPDGKCLFVIQGKRDVLAMTWGGGLGVFARGIDG